MLKVIEIKIIHCLVDSEILPLVKSSELEGFSYLRRLTEEYKHNINRFDKKGELLIGAYHSEKLIGICGLNQDPFLNDKYVSRLRRVYVSPVYRRHGVGRKLVEYIITHARQYFKILVLRTLTNEGRAFYHSLGFIFDPQTEHYTHKLPL
ncbi:GNAT superfamily N-acetyltransferase [Paenibacillus sp. 1182]|uniref:GNAT family N-acetyltransferase n=1 Tax=unclassified Paenibacillus TaxID=185978 RepID=UPI000FABF17E|nr:MULTISPECIES: GNAT family N-acetyltransferase [unclassified Paenibacillus]MBP1172916.1 GNAT superfamily N-acetyltransferase [Paenibacillus sp. PvR133]MBP1310355.1 GNAT superfamily N-acetyltransferase [Paenibacillus sp. 1182]